MVNRSRNLTSESGHYHQKKNNKDKMMEDLEKRQMVAKIGKVMNVFEEKIKKMKGEFNSILKED